MSTPDREMILEEVAEAEVALADLSVFGARELAAMNEQLGYLRTHAVSLGMDTAEIDQLKLRVTGALSKAPANPAPAPETPNFDNPGPRGQEKIYPVKDRTKAVEDLFK